MRTVCARAEGRLRIHSRFASRFLSSRRDIIVYLPRGYETSKERYPVFYLQDGQNLFDPATAFGGQDWKADLIADELIADGLIRPLVMVGIYNAGVRRISEYTPTRDRSMRKGGKAERYAAMLVRELKPFIDREYRTLKSAEHTVVGGSSLGGLVSLVTALTYPRVFGGLALLSPSVWWDNRVILREVRRGPSMRRPRTWLDVGTAEGDSPQHVVEDVRMLKAALLDAGWWEGIDLGYEEAIGAGHNEEAWGARFPEVLKYLFQLDVGNSGGMALRTEVK
jgi:predicted alpha/beta superfamily hydrolase